MLQRVDSHQLERAHQSLHRWSGAPIDRQSAVRWTALDSGLTASSTSRQCLETYQLPSECPDGDAVVAARRAAHVFGHTSPLEFVELAGLA